MRAWIVDRPGPIAGGSLRRVDRDAPVPTGRQLLVRVQVCAVCRTDLHLAEGDLAPRRHGVIPGHEVVGRVVAAGPGARRHTPGARVGIAWLRGVCGACRFCLRGAENLCVAPSFTGWDADGGYAELAVVDEEFAYAIPEPFSDARAAPLLCAGIIGYRALRLGEVQRDRALGIYGFGASAHLAAQVALHLGARVHVMTRSADARAMAVELGVHSVQGASDPPPERLDSAVLFAPAGDLVPAALEALDRGGTLAVAGIHLSDIPPLDYQRHLFYERTLRSVTASTRADGREFLDLAAHIPLRVETVAYDFESADRALRDLAADRVNGVAVLQLS